MATTGSTLAPSWLRGSSWERSAAWSLPTLRSPKVARRPPVGASSWLQLWAESSRPELSGAEWSARARELLAVSCALVWSVPIDVTRSWVAPLRHPLSVVPCPSLRSVR